MLLILPLVLAILAFVQPLAAEIGYINEIDEFSVLVRCLKSRPLPHYTDPILGKMRDQRLDRRHRLSDKVGRQLRQLARRGDEFANMHMFIDDAL